MQNNNNLYPTRFYVPIRNHQNFKSQVLTKIQKAFKKHDLPIPTFQEIDKDDKSIICLFPKIVFDGMEFKGVVGRKAGHVLMLDHRYGNEYETHLSKRDDKCCICKTYHGNDSYILFHTKDGNRKLVSGECLKERIRETGDVNARIIIAINIIVKKLSDGYLTHRYTLKTYVSRICAIANKNGFETLDSKNGLPTVVLADYLSIEKKTLRTYYDLAERVIEVGSNKIRSTGAQNNVPLELRAEMKKGNFNPRQTVNIAMSYLVYEKLNPIGDMSRYIDSIGHVGVYDLKLIGFLTNKDINIFENEKLYLFENSDGKAVRMFHHEERFRSIEKGDVVRVRCIVKKQYMFKREPITVLMEMAMYEYDIEDSANW